MHILGYSDIHKDKAMPVRKYVNTLKMHLTIF